MGEREALVWQGEEIGWKVKDFPELKIGDIFALQEPDGTIVKDKEGESVFMVGAPPKYVNGNWEVLYKYLTESEKREVNNDGLYN